MTRLSLSRTKSPHVAVIILPFTSHPLCIHSLVLRLARSSPNTLFTFINTPTSNASLFNGVIHSHPSNLKPYDLHVPEAATLSEAVELFHTAIARPGALTAALAGATAAAAGAEVTCLLVDASLSVIVLDSGELRVPWFAVWTAAPSYLSAHLHLDLIGRRCAEADGGDGDDLALEFVPGLAAFRASDLQPRELFLGEPEKLSKFMQGMTRLDQIMLRASAVVVNSFRELCPEELNRDLESKLHRVLNVGFFTVSIPPEMGSEDPTDCIAWLDGQKPSSVAYVSFGTSVLVPEDEIKAMAEALEESETSFLWSLRDEQKLLLPSGFAERTRGRGKIVAWANQVLVLGHGSVGVHVSHCGNNSVSESVVSGVPMIGRPFWGDQKMHAKMVERVWGIGVTVQMLRKSEVVRALEMVLKEEEGLKMRERALALKKRVFRASSPTGSATKDFNALLALLSAV